MWQEIKNIYHLGIAILANLFYGFPSKKIRVIGVTGTDGKTTTTSLIYHILNTAGVNASMVTSVGAVINGKNYDVGFHVTTPSSFAIQRFLAKAACPSKLKERSGVGNPSSRVAPRLPFLVLETTSHALDQYRVFGIDFEVGVLTNVSHEHLDYHKTYENYVKTKVKLLKIAKIAIVNRDDESYGMIKDEGLMIKDKVRLVTYGLNKNSDVNPKTFPFKTNLIGEFNVYNSLAAIAACKALKISDEDIRRGLKSFKPPLGREDIVYDKNFKVMIDFAHTPNAFDQILKSIHPSIKGRLIHVFGSAGQRDASKRPLMGELSSKYADVIILTAEDPRSEKISKIMDDIFSGIQNSKFKIQNLLRIEDRKKAIETAIRMARKGDFILVTGKSHEKSMNYGHGEVAWDEYGVVRDARKQFSNLAI